MCKLFVALMAAIIFSIVAAERIAKQSKKLCYSSVSQRNPLRKLLIGMRNGMERSRTTIDLGYLRHFESELLSDTRVQEAVRKLIDAFPDYTLNKDI